MTLFELDKYFNSILHREDFPNDPSENGIQIENSAPQSLQIKKVAFAVDACLESVQKAAKIGANVLFVHHGIFWGGKSAITGIRAVQIREFIKNDIALYASHIPLDANEQIGNNFGLAKIFGLKNIRAFGTWHGMTLGAIGNLENPTPIEDFAKKFFPHGAKIYDFGKKIVQKIAIISGGAGSDFNQAAAANADLFVTGEICHENFHPLKETKISAISAGHYQTETIGVNLLAQKLSTETSIETIFLEIPTGL